MKEFFKNEIIHNDIHKLDDFIQLKSNAMLKIKPELFYEWDFEKNDELGLNVYDATKASEKIAWWKCKKGHEWDAKIKDRTSYNNGCPICSNKRIIKGINDLWTTHPHIANLLLNPEDGYKYTYGSGKRVDWKCLTCNKIIKNKEIRVVVKKGLPCSNCTDGFSLPEKIMSSILTQLNIHFISQKTFNWSNNKRYDFYIPSLNIIIEMHGEQHYTNNFKRGRTLKEEQENDKYKYEIALRNGIEYYIIINCMRNDFEYIKKNIIHSELKHLINFNNIHWDEICKNAYTSKIYKVCDLYNTTNHTIREISKNLNIHETTVIRYLKWGSELGIVNYKIGGKRSKESCAKYNKRKVVQLTLDDQYIKIWNSIIEASKSVGLKSQNSISSVCQGRTKSARGFKWMYLEDYVDKFGKIHNENIS